ncbi:hypothetical protein D9758_006345 [Tetrapyrgos nigripes]|uniref:Uncharacterized protein n=1 Tax=Tetrapyrgos nigripes TaxID=182062 RepID=A0A8H5G030_9AGAR|nr:hypothetical protein D9758_006345 [Tetrapyrgos nigripes]
MATMTMTMNQEHDMNAQLCDLLKTLSIGRCSDNGVESSIYIPGESVKPRDVQVPVQDVSMDMEGGNHTSDGTSQCSRNDNDNTYTSPHPPHPPTEPQSPQFYGCAYLQAIQSQMDAYQTTGGDYLEAIFTHREILCSFPPAHRECARAFTDIAFALERRAWRADREADTEAVVAFRHEAWMIANTLCPQTQDLSHVADNRRPHVSFEGPPPACIMPPMM